MLRGAPHGCATMIITLGLCYAEWANYTGAVITPACTCRLEQVWLHILPTSAELRQMNRH